MHPDPLPHDPACRTRWHCICTVVASDLCPGDTTFNSRWPDGSCGCSCHIEYADDPESWQPLAIERSITDQEFADIDDWLVRMDDAERVVGEE